MTTKLTISLGGVAILLGAGCGRPAFVPAHPLQMAANPIVGGTTDNGHPAVGVLYNSSQGFICSGTLIDTYVFLTAGHCTGEPFDGNASHYQIAGGTDPFNTGATWLTTSITSVQHHPQYSGSPNYDHDTAIFVIGGYDQNVHPAPMGWQQTVDDSVYANGTTFTAVGYGVTSGSGQDSGIKRTTDLKIAQPYLDVFLYGDPNSNTTQAHNTCSGDSGGPAISKTSGLVIGTVSYGDQNCQYYGADQRTDYNGAFIASFAGQGGGGGGNGTPTPTPSHTPPPAPDDTPVDKTYFGIDPPGNACSVALGGDASAALPAMLGLALGIGLARRKRA